MDRETVITHLQIIHTWAEFALERDLQFFTAKHLEDIAKWADDALNLLKEQEHKDKMFRALEDDWKRLKELLKEQERKKGSWDYGTQCSVCKGTIIPPRDRKVHVNFCPWCGADMRESYE